jgi:hypothetical protein
VGWVGLGWVERMGESAVKASKSGGCWTMKRQYPCG